MYWAVNNNARADCSGGTHWSSLVYDARGCDFTHYDSSVPMNDGVARSLFGVISRAMGMTSRCRYREAIAFPQQQNAYDCGMYALTVAALLLKIDTCSSIEGITLPAIQHAERATPSCIASFRSDLHRCIMSLAAMQRADLS